MPSHNGSHLILSQVGMELGLAILIFLHRGDSREVGLAMRNKEKCLYYDSGLVGTQLLVLRGRRSCSGCCCIAFACIMTIGGL